ncbi:MAG TPA: LuxR C-terminal-related transcriptional regulator [Burkholderiales bacterium]|nr:LuxR C-terminal-related transcriptional regulator [Burkholderiales bacterium]
MRSAPSVNAVSVLQLASVELRDRAMSIAVDGGRGPGPARQAYLTPRQRDVLELLCEGMPNKLICRTLNICAGTVKTHISCILRELNVESRVQAAITARKLGLLENVRESRADEDGADEVCPASDELPVTAPPLALMHRANANRLAIGARSAR